MKFAAERPYADPEKAARKLVGAHPRGGDIRYGRNIWK
jgi:hypothetical protein